MRSERKKGRAFLARFMVLLMIINLLSGINPGVVRADNATDNQHFGNNGQTIENSGITLIETAKDYQDGKFNVEMLIKGSGSTETQNKNLDVVLVVDRSGSMEDYGRMENAKKAAKGFVDNLLKDNGGNNVRVGLVSFAGNNGKKYSDPVLEAVSLQKDKNNLKKVIDNYKPYSNYKAGTFTQAALRKANELFENNNHKKIIVLVSDGEPTYAYGTENVLDFNQIKKANSNTPRDGYEIWSRSERKGEKWNDWKKGYDNSSYKSWFVKYWWTPYYVKIVKTVPKLIGYGKTMTEEIKDNTINEAEDIKGSGVEVFSVGIGVSSEGKDVLTSIASQGRYYDSNMSAGDLDKVLAELKKIITEYNVEKGILKVVMSDKVALMSNLSNLVLTARNTKPNATQEEKDSLDKRVAEIKKSWKLNGNTITLNNITLGENEELTLTYKAELIEEWKDGNPYSINESAVVLPKGNPNNSLSFTIPTVKDIKTVNIVVNKEWKNTPVYMRRNARVQLFSGPNENNQTATNEIRRIDANTENADSKVTFENLPSYKNGAKIVYTVKELDDKGGYVKNNTEFELNGNKYKAKYEATSVANTFNIVNTNCDNEFNVSVEKKWTGTPSEAKFKLIRKGDDAVKALDELILTGDKEKESFTKKLDRYDENGDLIQYIVREEVPDGYVLAGDNDVVVTFANPVAKFKNVNTQENISFTLKKVWVGGRASSARFTFTNDKPDQAVEATQSKEIDGEGDEWSETVTLPRYNKDGSEATYTVTEETIPGFTSELSENKVDKSTKELKATNTLESNETVDINIEKTWEGNIPEGAKRSVEVDVQKKNEKDEWVKVKSYTLTPVTSWKKSDKLPKYNSDGTAAEYRTVETAINGEEIPVTTDISNGYKHRVFNINIDEGSVKNAFEDVEQPADDSKRNIRVVKTWVNATKEQKKDVQVTLYEIVTDENGNSTLKEVNNLTLNSGNDWIGEFNNVERYVKPATPSNPTKPEGQGETSTSPTIGTDNSAVGEQPAVEPTPVAPAASNEPIAGANKNANKVKAMAMAPDPVKYVVIETEIDGKGFENITPDEETNDYELNGYFVSIESNLDKGGNTVFVFNEPKEQVEPQFAKVIATKVWDSSAQGKEKPVEFTLYREMDNKWVPTEKKVTLMGENDSWVATFDKLPEKDELGDSILYYVFETKIGDTVIQNLPDKFSEDVTYTTDTIDGGKYTVKITVKGNEDSNDIIDNVTITNSFAANPTGGGDDYTGPIIPTPTPDPTPTPTPTPDPTPDTTPTVDVPDDKTPQGDANINTEEAEEAEEAEENDEDVDDTDDDDILEVDNDDVPQGDAKIEDAIAEDPIDIDGDPTPRGPANLPQTGGTASDFLSLIGMGLIGLGLVVKKRK